MKKSNNEDKSSNENEPASDIENENESDDENETEVITTPKKPPLKGAKKNHLKENIIKIIKIDLIKILEYFACDGSEQRIISPMDKEAKIIYFSGKKGYFSINKLVYCLPNSKIIHMAESRPGARSDQGLIHEDSGFFNNFNGINEYIMGDKGFLGSDKVYNKFIIPEFDKPHKSIDLDVKESMKRFKSIRIIIENVFAHIKKWNITTHTFRHKIQNICESHHKIWCSIGFLVNIFVDIRL
ncbi:hypothetical protein ACTFIR_011029 [Dictyostelium discoideum]